MLVNMRLAARLRSAATRTHIAMAVLLICTIASPGAIQAQGLIWSLPADGTWIRYEGTYKQVEIRPNASEGDLAINWIREVTIKSLGQETAEYEIDYVKQTGPCRWIEIKVVTGKPSESGIDPGPIGARIYKVLVPEARVIGDVKDKTDIEVSYLQIVKGWRKTGSDPEPKEIKAKVLQVYPAISLLRHYKAIPADTGEAEDPEIGIGPVDAIKYTATFQIESRTSRSTHTAEIWRSKAVPFGLAKWKVEIELEKKTNIEPRSAFKGVSKIQVEMKAQETGVDAKSDLILPEAAAP